MTDCEPCLDRDCQGPGACHCPCHLEFRVTRRMFFAAPLAALTVPRPEPELASGSSVASAGPGCLPVRGWTYWHARHPHMVTGMQQPGPHYVPLGLLTVPGHPSQLVWRHS